MVPLSPHSISSTAWMGKVNPLVFGEAASQILFQSQLWALLLPLWCHSGATQVPLWAQPVTDGRSCSFLSKPSFKNSSS